MVGTQKFGSGRMDGLRDKSKVTIRPGFPGTVPIFEGLSRENYDVARDAHLSRFLPCVPILSRVCASFTFMVP